jgi:CHAT domain-containing protein/tetratricopeptide (TPR) repeat protein
MDSLEQTITAYREALRAAPDNRRADLYNNLGLALRERHGRYGRVEDMAAAIEALRQALRLTADESPALAGRLSNLGNALRARYNHTQVVEDLDEATALCQRAVEVTATEAPERLGRLNNLALCQRLRYLRGGRVEDLTAAIETFAEVLAGVPGDSPHLPGFTSNYGACLRERYSRAGSVADLQQAVAAYHRALTACAPDSDQYCKLLNNLGDGLRTLYACQGRREDLAQAVNRLEQAVAHAPPDCVDLPTFHNNLSNAYATRYTSEGKLDDLERALHNGRRAVELTPDHSPDLPSRLNNLGAAYRYRFLRQRETSDLEQAITVFREAVRLTAEDMPGYAGYLTNLGNCLYDHHMDSGRAEDLDEAIAVYQQAVQTAPGNAPSYQSILNNLGNGLRVRYLRQRNPDDLTRCIEIYRAIIVQAPATSPEQAGYYNNLAAALGLRYRDSESADDLAATFAAYRQAVEIGLDTQPETCLTTLNNWIRLAFASQEWEQVSEIHGYAEKTIWHLLRIQILREHQESWLRDTQGIAARAAYALARLDKPEQAALALETGLARLLSEALARDRTDLEMLKTRGHHALYQDYRAAVEQFHQQGRVASHAEDETARAALREAHAALNRAVEAIGKVMPDFLRPPSFGLIQQAAQTAPLVYIVATELGGVALRVNSGAEAGVSTAWLPRLNEQALRQAVALYLDNYRAWQQAGMEERQQATAHWLAHLDALSGWLGRVLAPLREGFPPDTEEIVLIPAGLLNLLPLHAAWTPDSTVPEGRRYALDTWRIRYAPNARALKEAARLAEQWPGLRETDRVLAIHDPDNSLPHSADEISAVRAVFPNTEILSGPAATRAAVLDALAHGSVLHFACHGHSDLEAPLRSGLWMAKREPLVLQDFLNARLNARLAVLSACETGLTGTQLPDESVSLAAGLLQSGAAGVVSSLWSVSDLSTMLLMRRFYELWRGEYADSPAAALQRAQQWVRDSTVADFKAYFKTRMAQGGETARIAKALYTHPLFGFTEPNQRLFAHPYHWAAFTYVGV